MGSVDIHEFTHREFTHAFLSVSEHGKARVICHSCFAVLRHRHDNWQDTIGPPPRKQACPTPRQTRKTDRRCCGVT
eukprot:7882229-Lingulodinium_polyedra.AAC.1